MERLSCYSPALLRDPYSLICRFVQCAGFALRSATAFSVTLVSLTFGPCRHIKGLVEDRVPLRMFSIPLNPQVPSGPTAMFGEVRGLSARSVVGPSRFGEKLHGATFGHGVPR